MAEGKYSAANDLAKWRYEQVNGIHTAPVLVQYYVTLMQSNDPQKATEIKNELITLLSGVDTSPKEIVQFAGKLQEENKLYEVFLMYQVAIHYCREEQNVPTAVTCLLRCCAGTSVIVEKGVESSKLSKELVINHIIPYMKQAKIQMKRHLTFNRTEITEKLAICLHCIEQCQNVAGDLIGRETSLKEAISLLQDHFGKDVEKKKIFGTCLNNLGHTMLMRQRFNEAGKFFKQAIAARQKAEDYDSIAERISDIQSSQNGLKAAQKGECSIL